MRGNHHVRFLGEGAALPPRPYPTMLIMLNNGDLVPIAPRICRVILCKDYTFACAFSRRVILYDE